MDSKRKFMQRIGVEAREKGKEAEQRVKQIALSCGYEIKTNPCDDYGGKIDLWINGVPFQISVGGKSVNVKKKLLRLGIHLIVAGANIKELEILGQIRKAFLNKVVEN